MIPEEHFSILEDVKGDLDTNKQVYGMLLTQGFAFVLFTCNIYNLRLWLGRKSDLAEVL